REEDHVGMAAEDVKTVADIRPVEGPADRVVDVVEGVSHEDPLAVGVSGRLREPGGLQAVRRAPGEVGPGGARLEDVVLEIRLVEQDESLAIAEARERLQAIEVPGVERFEVVPAQTVPGGAPAAAGPRLLVERRPDVAVDAADHLVIV